MSSHPSDRKLILHLCADIGSDSRAYDLDPQYEVFRVGADIGVENFSAEAFFPGRRVHGIMANPVCSEFQTVNGYGKVNDTEKGMFLVRHCMRVVNECGPVWWVLENPARGMLRRFIGPPAHTYQPWQYGSPWTKHTALWGCFTMPEPLYRRWEEVPDRLPIYTRPGRGKPNLAFLHKSEAVKIPEMAWAVGRISSDMDLRSMCSAGFAEEFKKVNP